MSVYANSTKATVFVHVSTKLAVVYCGIFQQNTSTASLSLTDINMQGFSATAGSRNVAEVELFSLVPATSYSVHCYTVSRFGVGMPAQEAYAQSVALKTKCCKTITVSIVAPYVLASAKTKSVVLSLSNLPSSSVTLLGYIMAAENSSSTTNIPILIPHQVVVKSGSAATSFIMAVGTCTELGIFDVVASVVGVSAAEYEVMYAFGNQLTVLSDADYPEAPTVASAVVNNDVSSFDVTFSAGTDRMGKTQGTFACSLLFSFFGASSAVCVWITDSVIRVFPAAALTSSSSVTVGNSVTLLSEKIRAACLSSGSDFISSATPSNCLHYPYAALQTVTIQSPYELVKPVVNIVAPSTIGACSDLLIDLTYSSGAGWRMWSVVNISVSTNASNVPNVADIDRFMRSSYVYYRPAPIRSALLTAGVTYVFHVELCNFLGLCSSAMKSVHVSANGNVPTATVANQPYITIRKSQSILLQAQVAVFSCSSDSSTVGTLKDIVKSWSTTVVSGSVTSGASIASQSKKPLVFSLSAYSLASNAVYDITFIASYSGFVATSTIRVSVSAAAVMALVTGGTFRTVAAGSLTTFDASKSYDEDTRSSSGLDYVWSCAQTGSTCNLDSNCSLISRGGWRSSTFQVVPTASNVTWELAVVVTKDTKSGSTPSIIVSVLDKVSAYVLITNNTISSTGDKLAITAVVNTTSSVCFSSWLVNDASIAVSSVALTPIAKSVPAFSRSTVYFVASTANLPTTVSGNNELVFSLICTNLNSYAAVSVNINSPPSGGMFIVYPLSGIELSTMFTMSAVNWRSSSLPLTYAFGVAATSTTVLCKSSQSSYCMAQLSGGNAATNFSVTCLASVADSFGATSTSTSAVTVSEIEFDSMVTVVANSLTIAMESGEVDTMRLALVEATNSINRVDCLSSPNCSALHRADCSGAVNTCGSCLTGFVGDSGDSNTACATVSSYATELSFLGISCTQDSDCGSWSVCSGTSKTCVGLSKTCVSNCSGHGQCQYYEQLETVEACDVGFDTACVPKCVCSEGYGGSACEQTSSMVDTLSSIRALGLQTLSTVVTNDDTTYENVCSWVSILNAYASVSTELNSASLLSIPQISATLLDEIQSSGISSSSVSGAFLPVIDSAVVSMASTSSNSTYIETMSVLMSQYGSIITSDMLPGESTLEEIATMFRMSSGIYSGSSNKSAVSMMTPFTATEALSASFVTGMVEFSASEVLDTANAYIRVNSIVTKSGALGNTSLTRLESDVFRVQFELSSVSENSTIMTIAEAIEVVSFVIPHTVAVHNDTNYLNHINETFVTQCVGGVQKFDSHTCSVSGFSILHNCSYATNRTLTSKCPRVLRTSGCSALYGADQTCTTVNVTDTYTICQCALTVTSRRRLASLSTVGSEVAASQAGSVTIYVASEFIGTMVSADEFNTLADLQRVLIVVFIFAGLWIGGLILICSCTFHREAHKKTKQAKADALLTKQMLVEEVATSRDKMRTYLSNYIREVFPSAFRKTDHLVHRIREEIVKHHRYALLLSPQGEVNDKKRILTGVQLLTVQTMLIFLLALMYDLQAPSDDGSCHYHTSQDACLHRKSILDSHKTYCVWTPSSSSPCDYNEIPMSVITVLYISVLVSTMTAMVNYPIDSLFELLSAPTADSFKLEKKQRRDRSAAMDALKQAGRRVSEVGRRVSVEINKAWIDAVERARRLGVVGAVTVRIPDRTRQAHDIAVEITPFVVAKATEIIESSAKLASECKYRHSHKTTNYDINYEESSDEEDSSSSEESDDDDSDEDGGKQTIGESEGGGDATGLSHKRSRARTQAKEDHILAAVERKLVMDTRHRFESLQDEIEVQRHYIPKQDVDLFDSAWGIDPTGEFQRRELGFMYIFGRSVDAERAIKGEIQTVLKQSRSKIKKLSLATDEHTGLEILHLFVLDVLGRDTAVARIFKAKSDEDFRHTEVVSRRAKGLAWFGLLLTNGFFIYYTMLRGFVRGLIWQRSFLIGCIIQCLVEVLLNETVECIWVNFLVPSLANEEVSTVEARLNDVVDKLCAVHNEDGSEGRGRRSTSTAPALPSTPVLSEADKIILNAPKYLFISTNVAAQFPKLLESMIVRSYQTCYPGELSKKWKFGSALLSFSNVGYRASKSFRLVAVMVTCLQFIGAAPFVLQRTFIRLLQPWLLSALYFIARLTAQYPAYAWSFICVFLVSLVVYFTRYYYILKRAKHLQVDSSNEDEDSDDDASKPRSSFDADTISTNEQPAHADMLHGASSANGSRHSSIAIENDQEDGKDGRLDRGQILEDSLQLLDSLSVVGRRAKTISFDEGVTADSMIDALKKIPAKLVRSRAPSVSSAASSEYSAIQESKAAEPQRRHRPQLASKLASRTTSMDNDQSIGRQTTDSDGTIKNGGDPTVVRKALRLPSVQRFSVSSQGQLDSDSNKDGSSFRGSNSTGGGSAYDIVLDDEPAHYVSDGADDKSTLSSSSTRSIAVSRTESDVVDDSEINVQTEESESSSSTETDEEFEPVLGSSDSSGESSSGSSDSESSATVTSIE
jgi:hypothetical protein